MTMRNLFSLLFLIIKFITLIQDISIHEMIYKTDEQETDSR